MVVFGPLVVWFWAHRGSGRWFLFGGLPLVQAALVSYLDGGLTDWLRERLFMYSLPIMAIQGVAAVHEGRFYRRKVDLIATVVATTILLGGLSLYSFPVTSAMEIPWIHAMGTFGAWGSLDWSLARAWIVTLTIAASSSLILLLVNRGARAPVLAVHLLLFQSLAFGTTSFAIGDVSDWAAVHVGRYADALRAQGVGPGDRVAVSGHASYFEASPPHDEVDEFFVEWSRRMGLSDAFVWQMQMIGRFDVQLIEEPEERLRADWQGVVFVSTTEFAGEMELLRQEYPLYLYRIPRRSFAEPG